MEPRAKAVSGETIFVFAPRRLSQVEAEINALETHLSALRQERDVLENLVSNLETVDTEASNTDSTSHAGKRVVNTAVLEKAQLNNGILLPENPSIKDMAIHVLNENREGMNQVGIAKRIGSVFGRSVQRSSLSPALHALEKAGRLSKADGIWSCVDISSG